MKKKILFVLVILLAGFFIYAKFVTRVFHKDINIPQPIALVNKQVSSVANIARWYLPFASADTTELSFSAGKLEHAGNALKITRHIGLSITYDVTANKDKASVMYSVLVDTSHSSKVVLSYESTLWNKLFGKNTVIKNAEASLTSLKEYFADTKKMYGYQMEVEEVVDTAFVFTSKVVAKSNRKEAFKNLFESLIKYASEKDLAYTGVRIFFISPYGDDSVHLFTSIGINNTKGVPFDGEFSLKKMPFKGRLLTAYYQGGFDMVNKSVSALAQFKSDNEMTSMAIPFVKLISEGIEFEDSQIIQAKACYPIQ